MESRGHLAVALTLVALGLAPGAAHLMELPVKMGYSADLYATVNSTLYFWFGRAGGIVQVAAAVVVIALAFRARHTPGRGLVFATAAALVVSLALWGALVAPVNAAWAAQPRGDPAEFAAAYERLRTRWEYGHVAAFIAWFTGWFGLVAVTTRVPAERGSAVARAE